LKTHLETVDWKEQHTTLPHPQIPPVQQQQQQQQHPTLNQTDRIYSPPYPKKKIYPPPYPLLSPIIIEEYKLVFFPFPKIASSSWKRLFARMNNNPNWCEVDIHIPKKNNLKLLRDYDEVSAYNMMTNPEWTRAVIVREPKERLLSAFLDKSIRQSDNFESKFCQRYQDFGGNLEECLLRHAEFDFFLTNFTQMTPNVHWEPLFPKIDVKWWPSINFIGYMSTLHTDSRRLLQSLYSVHDDDGVNASAWDRWAMAGWPENITQNCRDNLTTSELDPQEYEFMSRPDSIHATSAHSRMSKYYTPELERFVEERWADDYNNPFYHFHNHRIFQDETRNKAVI